ncbi:MAG: Vmc-like lipoprotein signal peptide domain-containing protein [Flavobacteriales bacterium]
MRRFPLSMSAILMAGSIAFIATSCGNKELDDIIPDTVADTTDDGPIFQTGVPTPNEFFLVIKGLKVSSASVELANLSKASTLEGAKAQALNFGIFSADLAYISTFDLNNKALDYFKAVKQIGDKLNITGAFDETVFQKVQDNLNNGDSLMMLSNDTYFEAYNYLIENERGNVLAMIVAGGWLESLHIVTSLVGDYRNNDETIQRIADQKLTLENIFEFMSTYSDDPDVTSTMEDLADIDILFSELDVVELESAETTVENGKHVLSGGSKFVMSKEKYDQLRKLVSELRNKYLSATL